MENQKAWWEQFIGKEIHEDQPFLTPRKYHGKYKWKIKRLSEKLIKESKIYSLSERNNYEYIVYNNQGTEIPYSNYVEACNKRDKLNKPLPKTILERVKVKMPSCGYYSIEVDGFPLVIVAEETKANVLWNSSIDMTVMKDAINRMSIQCGWRYTIK